MNGSRNEVYTVRAGDTLWKIASLHQVGVTELIDANPQIPNPDLIYIGQQINIPSGSRFRQMELEIVRLVNQERANRGISQVVEDWEISRVARIKSQDMIDNNYFSHNSPIYGSPFEMLTSFRIPFTEAAENIASGQQSAEQAMNSWMNSSGHRSNILNTRYNKIGVGIARRGTTGPLYFTQIFVRN